jgi:hypothetical protein
MINITSIVINDFSYCIRLKGLSGETKDIKIESSANTTAAAKIMSTIDKTFSTLSLARQYQNQINLFNHY